MEGRRDHSQRHHHGIPRNPMHPPPQAVYGYPVDTSWEAQAMMYHQQMHAAHGFPHPIHHMEGVPLPPGIPGLGASTDPLEAVLGPFPCARVRNLPYGATLEDILVLFQGLVVIDVVLIGAGEAFVVFANPLDYQMALQRDRQTVGRSFVEISAGSRDEYYAAIAAQQWQEQQREPLLSIQSPGDLLHGTDKDQPPGAQDMSGMWGGKPSTASAHSLNPQAGRGGGHQGRGGGIGPGAAGGRGEGPGRGGNAALPTKRSGGGLQVGEHTGFLRMRGLPFSAAKEDIASFFEEYNPILETIVLTYRSDGRATGEAYVGFGSPEDSRRAMDLHRKSMGTRYIELFLSNKEEHGRALARFGNR